MEIENRIAKSGLITIDLEKLIPLEKRIVFDIKPYLFNGIILKEKDFRKYLSEINWSTYKNSYVAVYCSEDVIIPNWAYLLVGSYLTDYAIKIVFGALDYLENVLLRDSINSLNINDYKDKKVIIKGCSKKILQDAYLQLIFKLKPHVSSLMYGEACSTVPIYKKK